MSEVFYCYSPTLHKELLEKAGQRYIAKGVNPSTNREYWLFLYNDELVNYLNNRPKTKNRYVKNRDNPNWKNSKKTDSKNIETNKVN